ncbi:MAG: response regulator [Pseudomonadota bacterium]
MSEAAGTVFIVDDDAGVRSALSRSLSKRGFEIEAYASAVQFLEAYDPTRPGCIILDQRMPGMSGLELQEHLAKFDHCPSIIFVTGHGGVPESVQAIKAGAIDFLEKPFKTEVLVQRIHAALEADAENRARSGASQEASAKLAVLTPREREIVDLIVASPSTTSSKEIARALDISPRTVDHHRARILEKMEIKSFVELMEILRLANQS